MNNSWQVPPDQSSDRLGLPLHPTPSACTGWLSLNPSFWQAGRRVRVPSNGDKRGYHTACLCSSSLSAQVQSACLILLSGRQELCTARGLSPLVNTGLSLPFPSFTTALYQTSCRCWPLPVGLEATFERTILDSLSLAGGDASVTSSHSSDLLKNLREIGLYSHKAPAAFKSLWHLALS